MSVDMKLLFIYLKAFSFTGGIEKFNRALLKALHELSVEGVVDADAISVYDRHTDQKYFSQLRFKGFYGRKVLFSIWTISTAWKYQSIVLGHLNLAFLGYCLKRIKPSLQLIIIAHGIEVWDRQKGFKRKALESANLILAVSSFTKSKILENNPTLKEKKITIFPDTLDPYFIPPNIFNKPEYLLKRYGLTPGHQVVLTLARLSSSEKYKGYDNVIRTMHDLSKVKPSIRYLLCGKADESERTRLLNLIQETGCSHQVIMTGFLPDEEIIDHYLLADVFAMQSKKEGFGIVFIEALACGRKVIAGSKDGSVDALLQGELGMLIDPDSTEELKTAVLQSLNSESDPLKIQSNVMEAFGFAAYKERLRKVLTYLNKTYCE